MTDATESLAAVRDSCERCAEYADADFIQIAFAHVRAIIAHIDAQAAEIEVLRDAASELIEFAETGHITGTTIADRVRVDALIGKLRDAMKEPK